MNTDDRETYRSMSDDALVRDARRDGVTVEMGVVLAERLAARVAGGARGNFQPRRTNND